MIPLSESIKYAVAPLKVSANDKNQSIELALNSEGYYFHDKKWIAEGLSNIIKNAISAIDKEGIINIIFNSYCEENVYYVEIEFQDNGCGIQPHDFNKIFNPFFTTRSQGAGLGLSVVYELVKSNQGEINIQSVVNEGTNVKLKFPCYGGGINE